MEFVIFIGLLAIALAADLRRNERNKRKDADQQLDDEIARILN